MTIECLIADDEKPARELLEEYVRHVPELHLVGSVKNGFEVMRFLREQKVDLLLLDIQMPDLTGVQLLNSLSQPPQVIFTTAYSEYAVEGFELDATDYLLKPISFERFVKGVDKAIQKFEGARTKAEGAGKEQIILRSEHKLHRVAPQEILYIEGLGEYVTFYLEEGKLIVLASLKSLEDTLPEGDFIRIHRSYIVNKEKVRSFSGEELDLDHETLPVGRSYKEKVRSLFGA